MKFLRVLFLSFILFYKPIYVQSQDVPPIHQPKYLYWGKMDSSVNAISEPEKKLKKFMLKMGMVWIDSNTFSPETQNGYDTIFNITKMVTNHGFFLKATEVSNLEYKAFQTSTGVPSYMPDTAVWNDDLMFTQHPFVSYYYQHPAYNTFPVVGVSHWQAEAFCKWKTAEINDQLREKGLENYEAFVSLPTEFEFQGAYQNLIPRWMSSQKKPCFMGNQLTSSQSFVLGCQGYRANFGNITTYRLEQLRLPLNGSSTNSHWIAETQGFPKVYGVYNLLGNVAEWTATNCENVLYNTEEYYASMGGGVLKHNKVIDTGTLAQRLQSSEELKSHYVIKGGSWDDDIFYLQPAAIRIAEEYKSFRDVGFRYVVYIKPKTAIK